MIVLRNIFKFKIPIPKFPLIVNHSYTFSGNNKRPIQQQLQELADSIKQTNIKEDYSHIASNYIQLEQQSFAQYSKEHNNDPQMMLMLLSTFQDPKQVADYLPRFYNQIDFFEGNQLLLLMEKILAFKPKTKPKVPYPKPLENIQSILVILSEIYPADSLLEWLKLVPLYTGKQNYVLFMGYFSILEKMSPELKSRNQQLWIKCHQKLVSIIKDQQQPLQVRVGIISLAFELNYGQAAILLLLTQIDYSSLDPFKNCLLFVNVSNFIIKRKNSNMGINEDQANKINKMLKKATNEMSEQLIKMDFVDFMKIQLMVQLWGIIKELKQVNGVFINIVGKLVNLICDKDFNKQMNQLSVHQLLVIFQGMEKHKVNNEKAIKLLLVLFSPHLHNMGKKQFIRLIRCLVTYVRQCEDYLISARKVLEERKMQFNAEEAVQINEILRRVQVLFPKKFAIK